MNKISIVSDNNSQSLKIKRQLIKILKNICRLLKINIDNKSNETLNKWVNNRKNDAPGRHNYSYSTYGVSRSTVEKKFRFYNDKKYLSV